MDSELISFLDSSKIDCSLCLKLSEEHFQTIDNYINSTYCLHEIHQLFQIFHYNLRLLHSSYILWDSGKITPVNPNETIESQYISINAHIINIISSGHTIDEAMKRYFDSDFFLSENSCDHSSFIKYRNNVYDSSFSYRLLDGLRNYAQHAHLPVSHDSKVFGFNLIRILNTLNFSHKASYATEVKSVIEEAFRTCQYVPMQSLTTGLAEYIVRLLSIYVQFWNDIKSDLFEKARYVKDIIAKYPENILKIPGTSSDLFLYKQINKADSSINSENHIIHVSNVENTIKIFQDISAEAKAVYEEYSYSYENLFAK